jgi:Protein of unknown function (DUF1353)
MRASGMFAASVVVVLGTAVAGCDVVPWIKKKTGATETPVIIANSSFKGTAKVEFLKPENPSDRRVKTLADFGFVDSKGQHWDVPADFVSDGASIPWGLWSITGGPFDGPYRDAALIHDYFCDFPKFSWEDTHRMFYEAAIARGTSESVARTMYMGIIYGGPTWTKPSVQTPAPGKKADANKWYMIGTAHAADEPKQDKGLTIKKPNELQIRTFEELKAWIERDKPSLDEIQRRTIEVRKLTVPKQ